MATEKVKFAVMADLHHEIMNDGMRRLEAFLDGARKADVDFIIHLGDFTYPQDTSVSYCNPEKMPENVKNAYIYGMVQSSKEVIEKYNSFEKPHYHVMGNHDFDFLSVEETVKMYDMKANYYSFHKNGWHFIVIDGNYIKTEDGKYEHYNHGHYFYKDLPYINDEQLEWLKKELADNDEPVCMFSHPALYKFSGGIKNYRDFEKIIEDAKARGKKIRICMNGHNHVDVLAEKNNTLYYTLNSISNMWVGEDFEAVRYCEKTEKLYPNLKYTIPYATPIYALVEMDDDGIKVIGKNGRYVQPGPKKIGFKDLISPSIKSFEKKWKD